MAAIGRAAIEGRRRLPSRRKTAIAIDRRLIKENLAPANFSDRYVSFSTRIIRDSRANGMTAMVKSRALFVRIHTLNGVVLW